MAGWVELGTRSWGLSPLLFRAVASAPQASKRRMRGRSCLRAASCRGVFRLLMAFTFAPTDTQITQRKNCVLEESTYICVNQLIITCT